MATNEYRIVRDYYAGYEAQVRRWWWPFWVQIGGCNTRSTVEASERLCRAHARYGNVAKYLGHISQPKAEPEVVAKHYTLKMDS